MFVKHSKNLQFQFAYFFRQEIDTQLKNLFDLIKRETRRRGVRIDDLKFT